MAVSAIGKWASAIGKTWYGRTPGLAPVLCAALIGALLLSLSLAPASQGGEPPPPEQPITEECLGLNTTGTLRVCGTLNPHSSAKTGYFFAYNEGASCMGGSRTAPGLEVEGQAVQVSSGDLPGLAPSTVYAVCLVATNSLGEEAVGQPLSFMTAGRTPAVAGESAHSTGPASAVLQAQIYPYNQATKYSFEYAPDASLAGGAILPGGELAAGLDAQPVSASIAAGLLPNTLYYYRAVASNETGGTVGHVEAFTTPSVAPQVATGPVESVGASTATLTGTLNPLHASTTYWFQYGTSEAYEASAPTTSAGAGLNAVSEATGVSGLTPDTIYHFRLVASNAGGVAYGTDQTFTTATPAIPPPVLVGGPPPLSAHGTGVPPKKHVTAPRKKHKKHKKHKKKHRKKSQHGRPSRKGAMKK